jgi:hypothetical protein
MTCLGAIAHSHGAERETGEDRPCASRAGVAARRSPLLLAQASGGSGRQPTLLSWRLKWAYRRSQDYASAETERHLEAEQRPASARRTVPTIERQRVMTTPDLLHAMQCCAVLAVQVRDRRPAQRPPSSDRDCPLDTASDRCLWHAGGTAGENDDRSTGAHPVTWAIGCAGRSGDADSKPAPAPPPPTTSRPTMKITIYGCSPRSRWPRPNAGANAATHPSPPAPPLQSPSVPGEPLGRP